MKVAFNRLEDSPTQGPNIFVKRLSEALRQNKIDIVNARRPHDIHFITIQGSRRRADQFNAKVVLRIDGIYHDSSRDSEGSNRGISDTYHHVDGIIFQANFAREMIYKHFGSPKRAKYEAVIHNAVDKKLFSPTGDKIDFGYKHMLVVSGRWQTHKRLSCMVDSFLALDRNDVGLIVLGEVEKDKQINDNRIKYIGFVPPNELCKYYRSADAMLHFAYIDWCPNTVIESIASGVPVISTHNGGVPEIVRDSGIIIKSEADYDMQFIDFQKLPKVDTELAVTAINNVLEDKSSFVHERNDLYMDYCVSRYIDFFKKVRELKK